MKPKTYRRRWGDNDHNFGPFTFARDTTWRPYSIVLSSIDDDSGGCNLRFSGFGFTFIIALPAWLLPPEREKIYPGWDAETVARLGRDWFWDIKRREYGFTVSDGFLQVFFGRQTHDSTTEQNWCRHLPWTQWRFVRHSLYGLDGKLFAHLPQGRWGTEAYEAARMLEETCPKVAFGFHDFDGALLAATTRIEEREWLFGTGWFKWLSWFRPSKINRSLDIKFSGETGRRKGSWKGGTIGHSITMLPGELHEAAFRRYCDEHEMTLMELPK